MPALHSAIPKTSLLPWSRHKTVLILISGHAGAYIRHNMVVTSRFAVVAAILLSIVAAFSIPFLRHDIMQDASGLPPWFAFTLGFKAFKLIELFPNLIIPAPVRMVDLAISGLHKSQIIVALNTLGIADTLADKSLTAQQLATLLDIPDADKLTRVMAAAAAFGVFSAHQSSPESKVVFRNNGLSAVLRQDHPNTVTHTIKGGMDSLYLPWGKIAEGLQQNKLPFELAHGMNLWDFLAQHPQMENQFSLAMASQDKMGIHAILTDFKWGKYSRVIDVGAAYGSFLADIMQQSAKLSGTVCDLPQVIERAEKQWQSKHTGLLDRASFVHCDFLKAGMLPAPKQPKEVYVLRDILHDWSDESAVIILKNLRKAIGNDKTASVLLVEAALHGSIAGLEPSVRYLLDINMLVSVDGKERTVAQFISLFNKTGFRLKDVHATRGLYKVIEVVPLDSPWHVLVDY